MIENAKESVKITIVGTGLVGSATAYALIIKGLASEIVLIDKNRSKAEGEAMDLRHGMALAFPAHIVVGDYEDAAGSDVVIIAAGANRMTGQTRLDLAGKNVELIKEIMPRLARHCPNAVVLVTTNPVDVITYAAWKVSGLPASRILGSGTVLDSSRFRYALSSHCGVDARNVHAYIVGEHGDSQVPVWSLTNIGGVPIDEFCVMCGNNCTFPDKEAIFNGVRNAAYDIIARKGATYYGIGLAICRIVEAIIRDERSILTVSSLIQGQYEVTNVCLSLPAVIGRQGVANILEVPLKIEERRALAESAEIIKNMLREVGLDVPVYS